MLIRGFRRKFQFLVGLKEQIQCLLGMTGRIMEIRLLSLLDTFVGNCDVPLSFPKVPVLMDVDVDYRRLSKHSCCRRNHCETCKAQQNGAVHA